VRKWPETDHRTYGLSVGECPANRARQSLGEGEPDHEQVKPFIRIQLVGVQPGQSRSGQAGSESCHSLGDRWVRSVDSEEAGRVDSAPKAHNVADADVV